MIVGNFPYPRGYFCPLLWPTLAPSNLNLTVPKPWSPWSDVRADAPRHRGGSRAASPQDLLRVLPAQDCGDGEESVGDHQEAGPAGTELRLGDVRRRRLHARA